jgi:aryl-alcohol dehydrogenase-like predicted oxidoreductase
MTFGEDWGWGAAADEAARMFNAFVAAGGNFIDTANRYTNGSSERILGELIRDQRENLVIASKYSLNVRPGDPNAGGNHRKNLVQSLEASLRRLKTEYLDLYWLHAWDFTTAVDEVMRALDDVVRAGKVLHVGISDAPAWIVAQSNTLASLRGWSPFAAIQVQYNLIERTVERDLLPMARAFDLGVLAWSPLAGGVLSGKYASNGKAAASDSARYANNEDRLTERNLKIAAVVAKVAKEVGATSSQAAIAWLRSRGNSIIPILGARTYVQFEENLKALDVRLDETQLRRLNDVSAIDLGFPHDFITPDDAENFFYGLPASQLPVVTGYAAAQ